MPIYVKLKEESKYESNVNNPKIGSKHETTGILINYTGRLLQQVTIIDCMSEIKSDTIYVKWADYLINSYKPSDLVLCTQEGTGPFIELEKMIKGQKNDYKSIW